MKKIKLKKLINDIISEQLDDFGTDDISTDPNNPTGVGQGPGVFQTGGTQTDTMGFIPGEAINYPGNWNPDSWANTFMNVATSDDIVAEFGSSCDYVVSRYLIIYPKWTTDGSKGPLWLNMIAYKLVAFYSFLTTTQNANYCLYQQDSGEGDLDIDFFQGGDFLNPIDTDSDEYQNYINQYLMGSDVRVGEDIRVRDDMRVGDDMKVGDDMRVDRVNEQRLKYNPITLMRDKSKALATPPTADMMNRLGGVEISQIQDFIKVLDKGFTIDYDRRMRIRDKMRDAMRRRGIKNNQVKFRRK